MKLFKNANYEYKANNINEENGYTKWYDKETHGKKLRLTGTYSQCVMIAAVIGVTRLYAQQIKNLGALGIAGLLAANFLILVLIVLPIREIMHLLPLSKGKFDNKCILSFKKYFSVYNGNISRTQVLLSLILPLAVLGCSFTVSAVLTSGIIRYLSIFLLLESCYVCSPDIVMLFICIKRIGKNETVFGEYKC